MKTTSLALVTAFVTVATVTAQDPQWLRTWEHAQTLKPARTTSTERIAPVSEPGIPFTVRAQVLDASGKPLPNVEVFAYQTDQHGIYAAPGAADPWRLKGWATTDAEGGLCFTQSGRRRIQAATSPDTCT